MITPNPHPHGHIQTPPGHSQRWWLHPLPGSLSSWSSLNILGWEGPTRIIESISSEWHNQGSKPQPCLCQHYLSSSQGLSIPSGRKELGSGQGQHRVCCSCSWCHSSSHGPGAALHPPLCSSLCLGISWCQGAAFWTSPKLCYTFFWLFLPF